MFYTACPACTPPPIALDDSVSTPQGVRTNINVLGNDLAGSGPGPLRVTGVSAPGGGTAATNLADQIVYSPNASFLGDDTFTYTMTDGSASSTATVNVNVYFSDGSLWFPFNQTSGLTTDEAGEAYTASLIGFTNEPAEWVTGRWNQAIQFDGVEDYLSINGYSGILGSAARTCAAWVKTTSASQMPVLAWGPNSAGNKWTFLVQNGHARIEITSGYVEGTRLVNDGQWHHVAVSFTNNVPTITNAKLYVDGILETNFTTTLSEAVNTTSSGNVKIGSDVQSRYFAGLPGRGPHLQLCPRRPADRRLDDCPRPIRRRLVPPLLRGRRHQLGFRPRQRRQPALSSDYASSAPNPGSPTAPNSSSRAQLVGEPFANPIPSAASPAPANSSTSPRSPPTSPTGPP